MKLEQSLKHLNILSPHMMQSMEILQMSTTELEGYLQQLALENPVMELKIPDKTSEASSEEFGKLLQWLDNNDRQNAFYHFSDIDDAYDPLFNASTDGGLEIDLYTHLKNQLDRAHSQHPSYFVAKFLAGCLNESGYLDETLENLAHETCQTVEKMRDGLNLLRSLDPPGVGACTLSQCLVLQLQRMGETGCVLDIADRYLHALSRQRYKAISLDLGVSVKDVEYAAEKIRNLDPRPGESFKRNTPSLYIIPDVYVREQDGSLTVTTNKDTIPRIKICSYYKRLLKETPDQEVRSYLDEKTRQVRFAMRAVQNRNSTLLTCAKQIVLRQEQFFLNKTDYLLPMTQDDIASDLGIHGSTVSRAIRDKYVQCVHGVYPLSYFFNAAMGDVGSHGVQVILRKLIEEEDKAHPLSDQKLSDKLSLMGCRISRRTISKYRDILGIPDVSRRKR